MLNFTLAAGAQIAEIVGAVSIVGGLVFGLFQIRFFRAQQRDAVAANLTQTFYNRDLAHALALIQQLPDGISLQALRERGPEYVAAAVTVTTSFETMGLLVFKRIAPLSLVLDLAGGIIGVMHGKLHQWQEDTRIAQNQPSWGEWFEWLGEQASQHKLATPPAHRRFRDWQP